MNCAPTLQLPALHLDNPHNPPYKTSQWHRSEMLIRAQSYGHHLLSLLLIADNEHIRNLLKLRIPYLSIHALLAHIHLGTYTGSFEHLQDFFGIPYMAVRDGNDHCLNRGKPYWEGPGIMLKQDRDQALQGAEVGPVDHDRPVTLTVLADILQIEALRQVVVHLRRTKLPLTAQSVAEEKIEFGP